MTGRLSGVDAPAEEAAGPDAPHMVGLDDGLTALEDDERRLAQEGRAHAAIPQHARAAAEGDIRLGAEVEARIGIAVRAFCLPNCPRAGRAEHPTTPFAHQIATRLLQRDRRSSHNRR